MSAKPIQNCNYSRITSSVVFGGASDEVSQELPVVQELNPSHAEYIDGPFSRSPTSSTLSSGRQEAKSFRKSIISTIFEATPFKSSSPSLGDYGNQVSEDSKGAGLEASRYTSNFESSHSTDPPRPSRHGYEWVWFPEGYWAEREIAGYIKNKNTSRRAKRSSDGHASAYSITEVSENPPPRNEHRRLRKASSPDKAAKNTDRHSHIRERPGSSSVQTAFRSLQYTSLKGESEGLYGKTKRIFGWRLFPKKEKVWTSFGRLFQYVSHGILGAVG